MMNIIRKVISRLRLAFTIFFNPEYAIPKPTYCQDGLVTFHVCHFMKDKKFMNAYDTSLDHPSLKNYIKMHWRVYIACWVADKVKSLDGDFVECGVDRAVLSRTIVQYIDFKNLNKKFYLLDTYCGIQVNNMSDEEIKINDPKNRNYKDTYEIVSERFKEYPNVILIKGEIPDTLKFIESEKIVYLSIDMNNVVPEIAAAKHCWDKIVSGGIIVLDDYAYGEKYKLQREAFDKFAEEKNVKVLNIPTGQGLIFKP